jgi:hypothetical protein
MADRSPTRWLRKIGEQLDRITRSPKRALPPVTLPTSDREDGPVDDKSWSAGDLAECVSQNGWMVCVPGGWMHAPGPRQGEVRIVRAVTLSDHPLRGQVLYLAFARYPGQYEAACFRKLQPIADTAGTADADFLRDFADRLKPAKVIAPAPQENA